MAYVAPTTVSTGSVLTASRYNADVVENVSVIRNAQINIQSTTKTDAITATLSTTYATISGMTVTITPSSATSKVLVIATFSNNDNNGVAAVYYRLVRGSTAFGVGDAAGSRTQAGNDGITGAAGKVNGTTMVFMDSPATTSATTYALQWRADAGTPTGYFNRSKTDTDAASFARTASSITAIEVPV